MIYKGIRNDDRFTEVTVDGNQLKHYKPFKDFDGFGFQWGYKVNGAKQLAFAILMEEYKDKAFAEVHWQLFYEEYIFTLWQDEIVITSQQIRDFFVEYAIAYDTERFVRFMEKCQTYEKENFTTGCGECAGGIVAQICCSDYACGCMGLPYDYKFCPNGCNAPDWFTQEVDK